MLFIRLFYYFCINRSFYPILYVDYLGIVKDIFCNCKCLAQIIQSMIECTNEYIIEELKNGSQELFCYLYDKYYADLNRFAFHIIMCDDSHDIVNDVFIKLWERHTKISPEINIKSYLYKAVRNASLNHLKHRNVIDSRHEKIVESMLFMNEKWDNDSDELLDIINESIDKLPEQQKKIINMKYKGMSHIEIAAELSISTKTVNNHIFSAYKFIRKKVLLIFF